MFSLAVMLGTGQFRLLFKTEEVATASYNALLGVHNLAPTGTEFKIAGPTNSVAITDDFGQTLWAKLETIHGILFEDMDKAKLAAVELMLFNARVQNAATKAAQADPSLRAGHAAGPAIIAPMGNGIGR